MVFQLDEWQRPATGEQSLAAKAYAYCVVTRTRKSHRSPTLMQIPQQNEAA